MEDFEIEEVKFCAERMQAICHGLACSSGWWTDLKTGEDLRGKKNKKEQND